MQPRHDLPGVGRNLQDHPFVTLIWEVSDQTTLYGAEKPKSLAEWLLRRSGKLSSTVAEVVAFMRTRGGLPAADIQFHMGAAYYEDHGAETYDGHCMVIAPVLVSPQGARAGVAALGRPDGQAAHPHEHALRARRRRVDDRRHAPGARDRRAGAAARESSEELKPGAAAAEREELEADLRRRLMLIYHPVGTARMSDTHEQAVVDSQLRVHGLQGLRVVDASIMPMILGGNTNAPTIMIAERGADLIRGRVAARGERGVAGVSLDVHRSTTIARAPAPARAAARRSAITGRRGSR